MNKNCKNCKHGVDYGESVKYIYCEKAKRRKAVKKTDNCKDWSAEENQRPMDMPGLRRSKGVK